MYEFEIIFEDGKTDIIFGYSLKDAIRRFNYSIDEIVKVLHQEYVD